MGQGTRKYRKIMRTPQTGELVFCSSARTIRTGHPNTLFSLHAFF
jgi:hypothetical protein